MSQDLLYSGKAKTLFKTDTQGVYRMHFRDDASAFNGVKLAKLENKGRINNAINAFIMSYLRKNGVDSHFIEKTSETDSLVHAMEMIPVECVIRNVAAGGLCKRLGVELGTVLNPPTFEYFYKSDALGDPMINSSHILSFKWATETELEQMKALTHKVNVLLSELFSNAGMRLVDYKLEFGRLKGKVVLGDEISPDGCRIWDAKTNKILDKDRFRQDLGEVTECYQEIADRLGIQTQ